MSGVYSAHGDVLKAGVLDRRGLVLGRWKRRFYILRDTFLFICREEPESLADGIARPDHVIFLNTTGVDCRESPPDKKHPHLFTITIKQPKEEHVLAAPTEEERADWVEKINASIKLSTDAAEAAASAADRPSSRNSSRAGSRAGSRTNSPAPPRPSSRVSKPPGSGSSSSHAHTLPPSASFINGGAATTEEYDAPTSDAHAVGTVPSGVGALGKASPSPSPARVRKDGASKIRKQLFVATPNDAANVPGAGGANINRTIALPQAGLAGLSLQPSAAGSTRAAITAISSGPAADALRLDAFTLRTRTSILDGGEDDDDAFEGTQSRTASSPCPTTEADLYDAEENTDISAPAQPNGSAHARSPSAEPLSPSTSTTNHHRRSATSLGTFPASPRTPSRQQSTGDSNHASSQSISALDSDTLLKLKQIEASSHDPELLELMKEHGVLDEKIAKLKLHKRVLGNELKSLLPRLGIQTKVNVSYLDEIKYVRALHAKRHAHVIQTSAWVGEMRERLKRSEPQAFLKAQRRAAQMELLRQQGYTSSAYTSPASQRSNGTDHSSHVTPSTPAGYGRASPRTPYVSTPGTPATPHQQQVSPNQQTSNGSALSGTKIVHSELIRLSNQELDTIEEELRTRMPTEPPSPHALSALELDEQAFVEADASVRPPELGSDARWIAQTRRRSNGSRARAMSDDGGVDEPSSAPSTCDSSDPHTQLLRAHTRSLNDLTHVLLNILLREVALRRQVNLLQQSIYKLTSEKESSFRAKHALTASNAALQSTAKGTKAERKKKK